MRIRFFNTYEPVTSFYRDLVPYLADLGVQVELCISAAEYRTARSGLDEVLKHPLVRITRLPSAFKSQHGGVARLGIILSYVLGVVFYTLFSRSPDLNVFLTQPPLFSAWGVVLKAIRRQPFSCVLMDVYPDVAIRDGLMSENSLAAVLLAKFSRFVWSNAAALIVIGRCMKEIVKRAGVRSDCIHVIPNWSNENQVSPVPARESSLRSRLGIGDDFVVLYSGNIGASHVFDDLLEVAGRLRAVRDLKFVFIGDGSRRAEILEAREKCGLDNVILLPFQPVETLSDSLSVGDVHFICLREGFEGLVVPSKAYGALAVGRPIIYQGSAAGEIARMIAEEGVGAVVPLRDPGGLGRTILWYYGNRSLVEKQGRRARELSLVRYGRMNSLEKYRDVLLAVPWDHPDGDQRLRARTRLPEHDYCR